LIFSKVIISDRSHWIEPKSGRPRHNSPHLRGCLAGAAQARFGGEARPTWRTTTAPIAGVR
jgi:hypothetical protein